MKFEIIWYDQNEEKARDIIEADNAIEAEKKGYLKYNGNPPGELLTITRVRGRDIK